MIAYTATAWRRLLRAPRGWKGRVPTAGDCYRFCLYPDTYITVEGHTDSTGKPEYNQKLSERRAGAVRDLLAKDGVPPSRIKLESLPTLTVEGRFPGCAC